jgi:hypothetical protein
MDNREFKTAHQLPILKPKQPQYSCPDSVRGFDFESSEDHINRSQPVGVLSKSQEGSWDTMAQVLFSNGTRSPCGYFVGGFRLMCSDYFQLESV